MVENSDGGETTTTPPTGWQLGSRHGLGGVGPSRGSAAAVAVARAAALHRIQSSSTGVLIAVVVAALYAGAVDSYARLVSGDDVRAAAVVDGRHSASSQHHARWLFAAAAATSSFVETPIVSVAAH